METKFNMPKDIVSSGEQIFDIAFHPTDNVLATATITGLVEIFRHGTNENEAHQLLHQHSHHESSVRGVLFSSNGNQLYSISSDHSILCVDGSGVITQSVLHAHEQPINKISAVKGMPDHFLTGDDMGTVSLWDDRILKQLPVLSWHIHEDFITDILSIEDTFTFLTTSGDSTLCAYDIRKSSSVFTQRSDEQESELNCCINIKNNHKIVTGTQQGVLLIFSYDKWGDCSDRYPGHPETIDCMLKIDENTIMTGSSDGLIRVVSIHPNKVLGVIGDHDDFPVEGMKRNNSSSGPSTTSGEGSLLASFSHDNRIRWWDLSMFADDDDDDEGDGEEVDNRKVDNSHNNNNNNNNSEGNNNDNNNDEEEGDWDDMDEDDDEEEEDSCEDEEEDEVKDNQMMDDNDNYDSDDDDDDDDDDANGGRKPIKFKNANEKFFEDL